MDTLYEEPPVLEPSVHFNELESIVAMDLSRVEVMDFEIFRRGRPKTKLVKRAVNRFRSSMRPTEPTSLSFEVNSDFIRADEFLLADITDDGQRHLVFATPFQLQLLRQAKRWFIDGTFKIVGDPFHQLMSVHAFVHIDGERKQYPMVFALMSRRQKADYVKAAMGDQGGERPTPTEEHHEDTDIDSLLDTMEHIHKGQVPGVEKTFDEQLQDLEQHPAFMKEVDPSQPLSPEMEGLMKLKYECDDPIAKAEAYKDDGNFEFKKKKYRIAIENYTAGIIVKCPDLMLNAVLYSNRAAAQFHLQNYRTAFNDCVLARKFKSDHLKAIHRGAMSCLEIKKYEDCIKWCDEALLIDSKDAKIVELRQSATKGQKVVEKATRKEQIHERIEFEADRILVKAIKDRHIRIAPVSKKTGDFNPLLASRETNNVHGRKVWLDEYGVLFWPVMFMYPEYQDTDYVQSFCENHKIIEHIEHMFGGALEPPPWDRDRKYLPDVINVYFEDRDKTTLHKVNKECPLLHVLQNDRMCVYGGTPTLIILVGGSTFEAAFLGKYKTQ